jgi:hypothetical protein
MPSLDRTSKAADYGLFVVTDSCGDLRFVLRELAYCIEDDAVFSTNRLMSQFPVLKVLRAKFIECLGCTVIT